MTEPKEAAEASTIEERTRSVGCQTEPNLIDKLINNHVRRQVDDGDLYQEYIKSAQCAQFWPLDKNPIRALVPSMLRVDLPEQHLKNESLMFDLVQAITSNSKLVNLLAKYIHHIVPNVIISKRIDLIPLITCTIRVCRDTSEQERLISLLFNLIKRPSEEQRRMIISGLIVVLQVSPNQSPSMLLPNLWDHVNDKFPERRILLAESCATLAHYVRPVMRTNLILSILIQLLKDKNAAVRSAACKSFSCLLTLIMDRNDEVFDACLSASEDVIQDVLQQTPVNLCEHRYELEQMRFCALETVYPLLCMWAVKLNRFRVEMAEFYLTKAQAFLCKILKLDSINSISNGNSISIADGCSSPVVDRFSDASKRRSTFFLSRNSSQSSSGVSSLISSGSFFGGSLASPTPQTNSQTRRQSSYLSSASSIDAQGNSAMLTAQRAASAYIKMLYYLIPFVFSDAVHGCAWLSRSNLNLSVANEAKQETLEAQSQSDVKSESKSPSDEQFSANPIDCLNQLFDRPLNFVNKLLDPTLIIDESAIVAFHDQLEQEHMIESLDWILNKFLPQFFQIISLLSQTKFYSSIGATNDMIQELLTCSISSVRKLCLLFGKHLTRAKIRPLIKQLISRNQSHSLYTAYMASLTTFDPIEQQEFEEIVISIRKNLSDFELTRGDVEILAIAIKIIGTNSEQIHSPSTRHKFLVYILDALVSYSNQVMRPTGSFSSLSKSDQLSTTGKLAAAIKTTTNMNRGSTGNNRGNKYDQQQQTQTKEFILIIFRHILTCIIEPTTRPSDWAQILVTKFLPLLISLANDSSDVHVCTYARIMCAQLVDTFDSYLNSPSLNQQMADAILPALTSLKNLTEQIRASNLARQIECLSQELKGKFFEKDPSNINTSNNNDFNNNIISQ